MATGIVVDEVTLKFAMRCFYPNDLENLINSEGMRISNKWGGYNNEDWGIGDELVIEFQY
jgi:hypothetical protein